MTKSEARERARQLWGDCARVDKVMVPKGGFRSPTRAAVEWNVVVTNGGIHWLDSQGHAICHEHCQTLEAKL